MILGFSYFTWFHTLLSAVALISGAVVMIDMLRSRNTGGSTGLFLITAVATSVTGFGFPFTKFLPSHGVGVVSLLVLAATLLARYAFGLAGAWRWIYAVGLVLAFYFNVFVLIAQLFTKVPALKQLAPTGSEPPFAITELVVLVIFAVLTFLAARRFYTARPAMVGR
jgi:hypothetical protein